MGAHCGHHQGHQSHQGHHAHTSTDNPLGWRFAFSFGLNLLYVIVQIAAALFAQSTSLLADAGHNLGDVAGLGFSGFANRLLKASGRGQFTYGYKKLSLFSSLTNASIMILTCTWVLVESVKHFFYAYPIHEPIVISVALIGVLINGGSALLFAGKHRQDLNVRSTLIHLAGDAVISLGVALTGGIIWLTHWYWLDPLVGILIAGFIIQSTLKILKTSFALLLDASPEAIHPEAVQAFIENTAGVSSVHDLHIWALSTQHTALTAHLSVHIPLKARDALIKALAEALKAQFQLHHITLQIEAENADCGQFC